MLKKIKLIVINDGEDHYIVLPNLSLIIVATNNTSYNE